MADIIITVAILLIVGAAVLYIKNEKKRGVRCVGCPSGGTCTHSHKDSGCGCNCEGK